MSNAVYLESSALGVTLHSQGASLVQVLFKTRNVNLLLDTSQLPANLIKQFCIGGTVGPYAGRLRQTDSATGKSMVLLHGGDAALHRADWQVTQMDKTRAVRYATTLKHGDGGLPGDREFGVNYTLADDRLIIDLTATTTHDTPISMTNHAYFTLGARWASELSLSINAQSVLVTDSALCPTGQLQPVAETPLDFTCERKLAGVLGQWPQGLDHSYVLDSTPQNALIPKPVASLVNRLSGICLTVATTQPCLQAYTASQLTAPLKPFSAVCLEAQGFPNGPACGLGGEQSMLAAGQQVTQRIVYQITEVL